jgi:hypothetical protein
MAFPQENCVDTLDIEIDGLLAAPIIIGDSTYDQFNDATSSKRNVTNASGIVVLASDDENGHSYGHGLIGVTSPTPTATTTLPPSTPTSTATPTATGTSVPPSTATPTSTATSVPPNNDFEIYLPGVFSAETN